MIGGGIMLEVQKYLQYKTLDDLENEFGILIKRYNDRVVLNYKMDSKPKYHPIVEECRGLILSLPDYNVLCRSFDRFYNYLEGDDHKIFDWNDCKIFTKMDGSLVNLYHDGCNWVFATRGTAYAEGTTDFGDSFLSLIYRNVTVFDDCIRNLDKDYTYIFELTSPYNRVVVRYEDVKLTLLAIRNKKRGYYIKYNLLKSFFDDIFSNKPGIELVKSYDFNNVNDIIDFVENTKGVEQEGVVVFDNKTQKRIKIKNSDYVALHHLKGEFSKKSFITLLLKGEEKEFLNYFPEYEEKLTPFINKFNELKQDVVDAYDKYKHIENQKEFALNVKDLPYSGFVFALRKGLTLDQIFSISNLHSVMKHFDDL